MPYADPEKRKAMSRAYRETHREQEKFRSKTYKKANPELVAFTVKIYRKNNPEKHFIKDVKSSLVRAIQIPTNLIPPELIEAKVMQLKVIRLLRDAKKKTPPIKAGSR